MQAQGAALDAQHRQVINDTYAPGTAAYTAAQRNADTGSADAAYQNVSDQQDSSTGAGLGLGNDNNFLYALGGGTGDGYNTNASANGPGFGSVLKDLLILAAIAGGIWLFVELGGIKVVKKFIG